MHRSLATAFSTFTLIILSGCLTSEGPFYDETSRVADESLAGTYVPEGGKSRDRWHLSPWHNQTGIYRITYVEGGCSMGFAGVLFQVGTNKFLDLIPTLDECDNNMPATGPSGMQILRMATVRGLHLAVPIVAATNGVWIKGIGQGISLAELTAKTQSFWTRSPNSEISLLVPDLKKQQEFLRKFGTDTNIFSASTFFVRTNNAAR